MTTDGAGFGHVNDEDDYDDDPFASPYEPRQDADRWESGNSGFWIVVGFAIGIFLFTQGVTWAIKRYYAPPRVSSVSTPLPGAPTAEAPEPGPSGQSTDTMLFTTDGPSRNITIKNNYMRLVPREAIVYKGANKPADARTGDVWLEDLGSGYRSMWLFYDGQWRYVNESHVWTPGR